MAIVNAAARLIIRHRARYGYSAPVLCLGVPDIYLTRPDLASECRSAGLDDPGITGEGPVSARQFLDALGLTEVTAIDIPGAEHVPDRVHDLNSELPSDLVGRFGVVLDPATTEHVFDHRTGLGNIVRALRIGGTVIHFVPAYSYNGGYFSINPNGLNDFYAANGFTDLRTYIVMWDRYRPMSGRTKVYAYQGALTARHAIADGDQVRFAPHVLFFARKAEDREELVAPIQHHEHGAVHQSAAGIIVRRVLPESIATYLIAWYQREAQYRRAQRHAFWV